MKNCLLIHLGFLIEKNINQYLKKLQQFSCHFPIHMTYDLIFLLAINVKKKRKKYFSSSKRK